MAREGDREVTSDTEHSEKPVREQLKKARISKASESAANVDNAEMASDNDDSKEEGEELAEVSAGDQSPQRKRSFEELEDDQVPDALSDRRRHHTRKRSRDSTAEEDELNNAQRKLSGERSREPAPADPEAESNGDAKNPTRERPATPEPVGDKTGETVESVTSPKTKRSRLEASATEQNSELPADAAAASKAEAILPEPEAAGAQGPDDKAPPTSRSADASAPSPFASLSGPPPTTSGKPQTSPSAFAASGFSSLAGASTSGFGAIGKNSGGFGTGGSFATGNKSAANAADATSSSKENGKAASDSTFGGALGQKSAFSSALGSGSAFGSAGSGFGGKFGQTGGFGGGGGFASSGFGSLAGGGGLSSFASGKPSSALGGSSKPTKAFGAPADEEEEGGGEEDAGEDEDAGFKSPLSQDSDKQDERFYEQELETGEEDEKTECSFRAKLYNYATKEWKERGVGVVRLNTKKAEAGDGDSGGDGDGDDEATSAAAAAAKPKARLLMRAEGSHRVILNTPIMKEVKYGAPDGTAPKSGCVYFMGMLDRDSAVELLQLRCRQPFAQELYDKIAELQAAL